MHPLSRKEFWLSFFLITLAVLAIYGRTLFFGFVWDDHIEVLGNTVFHQAANLEKFFTVPYWTLLTGGFAPYHRPMIPVMILFVSHFFGTNPFGYHLLNLTLYLFTCWAFYLFLRKLPLPRIVSVISAIIFTAHPAHAEAVAWGSARPVLLSGLCFVLGLIFSFHAAAAEKKSKQIFFLFLLFASFSIGLLSYHSILTLAPFIFLTDLFSWPQKKSWSLRVTEYLGYALLGAGFIASCLLLFHRMGEHDLRPIYSVSTANLIYTGAPLEGLLAPLNTLTRYSEILFLPMNLVPDAQFEASALSLSAAGVFILMAVLSFLLCRHSETKAPARFSILWMFCGILTAANFVPQGGLFADRYLYISSMGFSLWAGLLLNRFMSFFSERLQRSISVLIWALAGLMLLLGLKSWHYAGIWKNEMAFWLEASILAPHKARTHDKLAGVLESSGHLKEAEEEYRKVLELSPEMFILTHQKLARVLKQMGRAEEAESQEKLFQQKLEAARQKAANHPDQLLNLNIS